MAIDPVLGTKTANERFAGAEETYCLEAFMQDGKALQAGTSHFLGQNFAKAFDVQFTDENNTKQYVRASSRGVSTRLMGALIMSHGDDNGLILPPALAPVHVVIVPIFKTEEDRMYIMQHIQSIVDTLASKSLSIATKTLGSISRQIQVKIDADVHKTMGWKYTQYELEGIAIRIGVGMRDIEKGQLEVYRRDTGEKKFVAITEVAEYITTTLAEIQAYLVEKNRKIRQDNTVSVDTYEEFQQALEQGKFVMAHWDGSSETELQIKEHTKATIRCIPLDTKQEAGKCILSGKASSQRVLFARAY